jgi:hypothetical protein
MNKDTLINFEPKDGCLFLQGNLMRLPTACSLCGLLNVDLVEATSDSLAKVANTTITLIQSV